MSSETEDINNALKMKLKRLHFRREAIDIAALIDNKRYTIEESSNVKDIEYVFSVSLEIYAAGSDFSEQDMIDFLDFFPEEYGTRVAHIGSITTYEAIRLENPATKPHLSKSRHDWFWKGELFLAFDGSIWVYSEDVMVKAAESFFQFLTIKPLTHYGMRYHI